MQMQVFNHKTSDYLCNKILSSVYCEKERLYIPVICGVCIMPNICKQADWR